MAIPHFFNYYVTYLSIFNTYTVLQYLLQCVSYSCIGWDRRHGGRLERMVSGQLNTHNIPSLIRTVPINLLSRKSLRKNTKPIWLVFHQFEDDIVDICLKILDVNPKCLRNAMEDFSARCNPIYVSRVISAMVCSNILTSKSTFINVHVLFAHTALVSDANTFCIYCLLLFLASILQVNINDDDNGVLQGKWDGLYSDGVPPQSWSSSVIILRQWLKTGCRAVKYGQCWVFASVMCTGNAI